MLSKNELTKQTVKELFEELGKIENKEKREFKQYWLLNDIITKYAETECIKCRNSDNCWSMEVVFHTDNIVQLCKHEPMLDVVKLREQVPIKPESAGNENHKKWHDEVKEMREIAEQYSWESIAKRTEEVYDELGEKS